MDRIDLSEALKIEKFKKSSSLDITTNAKPIFFSAFSSEAACNCSIIGLKLLLNTFSNSFEGLC